MTVPDAAPCGLHAHRLKQLEDRDRELNGSVKAVAEELKQVRIDLPGQFAKLHQSVNTTIRNWFVGTIIILIIGRIVEGLLP